MHDKTQISTKTIRNEARKMPIEAAFAKKKEKCRFLTIRRGDAEICLSCHSNNKVDHAKKVRDCDTTSR